MSSPRRAAIPLRRSSAAPKTRNSRTPRGRVGDEALDTRARILREALGLFANAGFAGVSVRDVALRVKISAPTLYHHFPNKQALYAAALAHAFARIQLVMTTALGAGLPPRARLRRLVAALTTLAAEDETVRKLVIRELLDGDEERHALLAAQIFSGPHRLMVELARELASDLDPYLLVNSLVGMVLFGIQSAPLRRHLPGGRKRHEEPAQIARHVATVLERAGGKG